MKDKGIISKGPILILVGLMLIIAIVIFMVQRYEGRPPTVTFSLSSTALGSNSTMKLQAADEKTGLRRVWVAILQEGQELVLADKYFPSAGLFAGGLIHDEQLDIPIGLDGSSIKDGKAMLRFMVRDYSWRNWGKGNQFYKEQEIVVDTKAPEVNVVSKVHYLAQGGSGLVIYRLSEQCPTSGVQVGDHFYPGYAGGFSDAGLYMAFFAVAYDQPTTTTIAVAAVDFAGNRGQGGLAYRINARRFNKDRIPISDQFLKWKMPEFRAEVDAEAGESDVDVFLKVNGDLRRKNYAVLQKVTEQCEKQVLWHGAFSRLPAAANRAGFADHRSYMYNGKLIDQQTHMGIDLASLSQAPVPAANSGKVVFTDTVGIYGKTVIIDHGFGLFSMYSHLSHINAVSGQSVRMGDIIGKTGSTGLAGGDHLHFGMLVHDTFVNPLEWWDAKWIKNNISDKIGSAESF